MNKVGIKKNEEAIVVSFSKEEIERLIHEASNRACERAYSGASGVGPWGVIRQKLIDAIRSR